MSISIDRRVYQVGRSAFGVDVRLYWYGEPVFRRVDWDGEPVFGRVKVEALWGPHPVWGDIRAALWRDQEKPWGEELYTLSKEASLHRKLPWRVEHHKGMSGAEDWRVRVRDRVAKEWGTAGAITSSLHLSYRGTVALLDCPLEDFWIYVDEVSVMPLEELLELYADMPPRRLPCDAPFGWHMPGLISGHDPEEDGDEVEMSHAELAAVRQRLHEEYESDEGDED